MPNKLHVQEGGRYKEIIENFINERQREGDRERQPKWMGYVCRSYGDRRRTEGVEEDHRRTDGLSSYGLRCLELS